MLEIPPFVRGMYQWEQQWEILDTKLNVEVDKQKC